MAHMLYPVSLASIHMVTKIHKGLTVSLIQPENTAYSNGWLKNIYKYGTWENGKTWQPALCPVSVILSHTQICMELVYPEPYLKTSEGGYPRISAIFPVGIVPQLHPTPGFSASGILMARFRRVLGQGSSSMPPMPPMPPAPAPPPSWAWRL